MGRNRKQKGASQKIRQRIRELRKELTTLQDQLHGPVDEIEVTDHAIVRFLERIDGFDVQALTERMVTDKLREQVAVVGGTGKFPIEGGGHLVLENMRIVTVHT